LVRETSSAWQVALNALFLHGFSPAAINSAVPGGWSIAVEMSFYLVFPLLIGLGTGRAHRVVHMLLFALLSWLLLGVAVTTWLESRFDLPTIFLYYSQLTQFPIFPVGICIYFFSVRGERQHLRLLAAIAVTWLGLAFVGKFLFGLNTRPFFWFQIALFGLLIHFFVTQRIHLKWLAFLGAQSYSMYLFHFAVIDALAMLLPAGWHTGATAFAVFLAAVLIASSLLGKISMLTFEKWSNRAGQAIVAKLNPTKLSTI
jgi:peptidoglycan/LPS O-acetylase OafA/YrhL